MTHNIYNNIARSLCLALLMGVVLASCQTEIEFDGEETEPYIVVYGVQEADSTMSIQLSYSRFFLSNAPTQYIGDATVQLYLNGTLLPVDRVNEEEGRYYFDVRPQPGDSLYLSVVAGDKAVVAGTRVPRVPQIEFVGYTTDTTIDSYSDEYYSYNDTTVTYHMRFRLHDAAEENFYQFSVQMYDEFYTAYQDNMYFSSSSPYFYEMDALEVIEGGDGTFYGNYVLFDDALFNGKEMEFSISYDRWNSSGYFDPTMPMFRVALQSYSKECYRYKKTAPAAGDDFGGLFTEPVQVYSNVEGGIGVFASQTIVFDTLPIYLHGQSTK